MLNGKRLCSVVFVSNLSVLETVDFAIGLDAKVRMIVIYRRFDFVELSFKIVLCKTGLCVCVKREIVLGRRTRLIVRQYVKTRHDNFSNSVISSISIFSIDKKVDL